MEADFALGFGSVQVAPFGFDSTWSPETAAEVIIEATWLGPKASKIAFLEKEVVATRLQPVVNLVLSLYLSFSGVIVVVPEYWLIKNFAESALSWQVLMSLRYLFYSEVMFYFYLF